MRIFTRIILFTSLFTLYCGMAKAQQVNDSLKKANTVDSTLAIDSTTTKDSTALMIDSTAKVDTTVLAVVDTTKAEEKKSYFSIGLSYLSNNVYLGRKDSAVLPYLTFSAGYSFKSGFFIDGALNYLSGSSGNRIDAVIFDGGYSFSADKYTGEATLSKYFYSSQSTNVRSNVSVSASYFNSYDLGFITPTFTGTLNFGTKTDVAAGLGLEHTFFAVKDNLGITPTFVVNGSTQNYYNSYYKTRKYTIKRKNKAPQPGVAKVTGIVENASAFKILDYEASLPIDYTAGKFGFTVTPVYAIPVNPSVVDISTTRENGVTNTRMMTEKIQNNFYITVGVTYKFEK